MTNAGFDGLIAELNDEQTALEEGANGVYWKPETKGDELVGTLIKITAGYGEYGESEVLNIEKPDGAMVAAWVFGKVLDSELREKRPAPGKKIAIRFLGRRTSAAGHEYKVFRVATEKKLAGFGDYFDDAREAQKKTRDPSETPF